MVNRSKQLAKQNITWLVSSNNFIKNSTSYTSPVWNILVLLWASPKQCESYSKPMCTLKTPVGSWLISMQYTALIRRNIHCNAFNCCIKECWAELLPNTNDQCLQDSRSHPFPSFYIWVCRINCITANSASFEIWFLTIFANANLHGYSHSSDYIFMQILIV